jgi:hypothetical protein
MEKRVGFHSTEEKLFQKSEFENMIISQGFNSSPINSHNNQSQSQSYEITIKNGALIDHKNIITEAFMYCYPYLVPFSSVGLMLDSNHINTIPRQLWLAALNCSLVGIIDNCTPFTELDDRVSFRKHHFRLSYFDHNLNHNKPLDMIPSNDTPSLMNAVDDSDNPPMDNKLSTINYHYEFQLNCSMDFVLKPCIGLGIIRNIDLIHRRFLVILPPVTTLNLDHPCVLPSSDTPSHILPLYFQRGNMNLPSLCLSHPQFPCSNYVRSSEIFGEGIHEMKSSRILKRKSQQRDE